ncbi:hypothetical protein PQ455_03110 [Sphingomonas naphthae]|uniref:DUF1801 domain-containing protein n=1 Tax=Sphingomonas naphthae TaxID=1813468 RepID=A0ABY7TMQ6_9SPHN|nr:hypothetical protein [Sphingomonas naphthae]WCT74235.1 hypothetical protein PQ455_03110 [Sphingomonas naphthae]
MGDYEAVHGRLRAIMLASAGDQNVTRDEAGDLVVRTHAIDARTNQPGWFGTVTIKKSYVAYHLIPLYDQPTLAEGLSEPLAKRRQGKTCFNFKTIDDALFGELAALTAKARATVA